MEGKLYKAVQDKMKQRLPLLQAVEATTKALDDARSEEEEATIKRALDELKEKIDALARELEKPQKMLVKLGVVPSMRVRKEAMVAMTEINKKMTGKEVRAGGAQLDTKTMGVEEFLKTGGAAKSQKAGTSQFDLKQGLLEELKTKGEARKASLDEVAEQQTALMIREALTKRRMLEVYNKFPALQEPTDPGDETAMGKKALLREQAEALLRSLTEADGKLTLEEQERLVFGAKLDDASILAAIKGLKLPSAPNADELKPEFRGPDGSAVAHIDLDKGKAEEEVEEEDEDGKPQTSAAVNVYDTLMSDGATKADDSTGVKEKKPQKSAAMNTYTTAINEDAIEKDDDPGETEGIDEPLTSATKNPYDAIPKRD